MEQEELFYCKKEYTHGEDYICENQCKGCKGFQDKLQGKNIKENNKQ